MTVFVADAADAGLADAVRWLSDAAGSGDELLLLAVPDADPPLDDHPGMTVTTLVEQPAWLPGADLGVCGMPTARLLELAASSGFDVRACGPQADPAARALPASTNGAAALAGPNCDLSAAVLSRLFELARDVPGRAVAFDTSGFVAAAVASGAAAGGRELPVIVPAGYRTAPHVRVAGVREAIEARLASVDALRAADLRDASFAVIERVLGDEPVGLVVLPAEADYVDVHAAADVLERAGAIIHPGHATAEPGARLALEELSAAGRVTAPVTVAGGRSEDARAVRRKSARETIESKHFLSGRHIEEFVERHGPGLAGRILDFGCGNKPYADALPNADVLVGLDVEQSSEQCVDVLVEPGEPLPFADGWFDGALCTEVLEHLEEPWTALEEIGRVVRPRGALILSAPFVWPLHEEPRDFMRFSPHALSYLLDRAGFDVEVLERAGGFASVINQLQAERLEGSDLAQRAHIRRLNEQGLTGDTEDRAETISTHFPVLARRR